MQLNNLKRALLTSMATLVTLSAVTACGSNDATLNSQNLLSAANNAATVQTSSVSPNVKFGFKLTSKTLTVPLGTLKNGKETKVDLREFCSPIANQQDLGACTAFAIGKGVREFLLVRDHKPLEDLSALFLYYNERKIDGNIDEDAGSTITTGMDSLKHDGMAPEAAWPYDTKKFNVEPPKEAYEAALGYEITGATPLKGLQAIKDAVTAKNPVAFGIMVYDSFMKSKAGVIPTPKPSSEKLLGGHAVACVGFDDEKQVLIMRNSWGTGWGDKGYFYLPYSYFKLGLVRDAWTASATSLSVKK